MILSKAMVIYAEIEVEVSTKTMVQGMVGVEQNPLDAIHIIKFGRIAPYYHNLPEVG